MNYIDERNGEEKSTDFLQVILGESKFRITEELGELVLTKVDFDDNQISITPKVANQIGLK